MIFRRQLTNPVGSPINGNIGTLGTARKIIIHHTGVDNDNIPSPMRYHFVIQRNGTVHFGINTTFRSGATGQPYNNDNSIQIAATGDFQTAHMGAPQEISIRSLIADILWSSTAIPRINRLNLTEPNMAHFAMASRDSLAVQFRRHNEDGVRSHTDSLNAPTACPGINFYRRCRDILVPEAIQIANNNEGGHNGGGTVYAGGGGTQPPLGRSPTLGTGSPTDAQIRNIQTTLNNRYTAGLQVDGVFGNLTRTALLRGHQIEIGVNATGVWGPMTHTFTPILQRTTPMTQGNRVWILQAALYCRRHTNTGGLTSAFGDMTQQEVRNFQSRNGMGVDGRAGPLTMQRLLEFL